jgi:hypothetical protein
VKVVSPGFDQFPWAIRAEGTRYTVEGLELADGGFYRVHANQLTIVASIQYHDCGLLPPLVVKMFHTPTARSQSAESPHYQF